MYIPVAEILVGRPMYSCIELWEAVAQAHKEEQEVSAALKRKLFAVESELDEFKRKFLEI